jgi:hypothetical protein
VLESASWDIVWFDEVLLSEVGLAGYSDGLSRVARKGVLK